jgi:thioesterase domain-containing protein
MTIGESTHNLVFFPDYGGNTFYARTLMPHLGKRHSTYSLKFSPLVMERLHELSIEDHAQEFVKTIRSANLAGEIHLVGFSFAGLLAYETGRLLAETSENRPDVWLLDTMLPTRLNIETLFRHPLHFLRLLSRRATKKVKRRIAQDPDDLILDHFNYAAVDLANHPERYRYIIKALYSAMVRFEPEETEAPIIVFRAQENRRKLWKKDLGWQGLTRNGFRIFPVPGDHLSMLRCEGNAEILGSTMSSILGDDQ